MTNYKTRFLPHIVGDGVWCAWGHRVREACTGSASGWCVRRAGGACVRSCRRRRHRLTEADPIVRTPTL